MANCSSIIVLWKDEFSLAQLFAETKPKSYISEVAIVQDQVDRNKMLTSTSTNFYLHPTELKKVKHYFLPLRSEEVK